MEFLSWWGRRCALMHFWRTFTNHQRDTPRQPLYSAGGHFCANILTTTYQEPNLLLSTLIAGHSHTSTGNTKQLSLTTLLWQNGRPEIASWTHKKIIALCFPGTSCTRLLSLSQRFYAFLHVGIVSQSRHDDSTIIHCTTMRPNHHPFWQVCSLPIEETFQHVPVCVPVLNQCNVRTVTSRPGC